MKNILRLFVCILLCVGMSKCKCTCGEQFGTVYFVNAVSNDPEVNIDSISSGKYPDGFQTKVEMPYPRVNANYPAGFPVAIYSDSTQFTLFSREKIVYDTILTNLIINIKNETRRYIQLNFYFEADSTLTIRQTEVAAKSQQAHMTL